MNSRVDTQIQHNGSRLVFHSQYQPTVTQARLTGLCSLGKKLEFIRVVFIRVVFIKRKKTDSNREGLPGPGPIRKTLVLNFHFKALRPTEQNPGSSGWVTELYP